MTQSANMAAGSCRWSEDMDGIWETGCGEAFLVNDSTPSDNGMKFCCCCGKPLEQVLYVEDTENDD